MTGFATAMMLVGVVLIPALLVADTDQVLLIRPLALVPDMVTAALSALGIAVALWLRRTPRRSPDALRLARRGAQPIAASSLVLSSSASK